MEEILSQSALIVEVPEAEPAVGGHRKILDANAELGAPAHVEVVWRGPEDPQPFCALTELVMEAFSNYPPFEDQFADVIPHLTIAHRSKRSDMEAAARSVAQHLPILCRARKVTLLPRNGHGGSWVRAADFALRD